MKHKVAVLVSSTLLCMMLLGGCGGNNADSTSMQQEATDSIAMSEAASQDSVVSEVVQQKVQLSESEQKFKSAENYQETGDYYKAYTLYQKISADDPDYDEAQKRSEEMLELYWEKQNDLIEQGDYQTALDNTIQAMNFANMTSFSGEEDGLESTILTVAEKIAENCGFDNPKGRWDEIYSLTKFKISMDCTGIEGKSLSSLSKKTIVDKYDELSEELHSTYYMIGVLNFGEIHSKGTWYGVKDGVLSIRSDAEREKALAEEKAKQEKQEQERAEAKEKAAAASDQQKQDIQKSYSGKITQEYKNALDVAERCYYNLAFSKKQIYDYLVRQGYPKEAAQYAIEQLD